MLEGGATTVRATSQARVGGRAECGCENVAGGVSVGLSMILPLPILYGVWHTHGGSGGGSYIAYWSCNSIVIVWAMQMEGEVKGWWTSARTFWSERIARKGQGEGRKAELKSSVSRSQCAGQRSLFLPRVSLERLLTHNHGRSSPKLMRIVLMQGGGG